MSDKINAESISAKLRRWADESESADFVTCHPMTRALDECGLIDSLGGYVQERELFRRIADEIDREIDELRELVNPGGQPIGESIREIATGEDKYPWGDSKYPLLKRALDRYYLPRPLFEDGSRCMIPTSKRSVALPPAACTRTEAGDSTPTNSRRRRKPKALG